MRRRTIAGYLFALVSGCGTQASHPPDAGTGCGTYVATPSDAGCSELCQSHGCATGFCNVGPDDAGVYVLQCFVDHTGRRPAGLAAATSDARCAMGRYFALAAHLEAASVPAFERLAIELARSGAPLRLRRAAERSASDEQRHARAMSRLAHAHGVTVPAVCARGPRPRSVEAFARENAIEGCIKETYGAALARHQAHHAVDAAVRATFAALAPDELRHAELAWQIDDWVAPRLTADARRRVHGSRIAAARRLHRRELASRDNAFTVALGLPTRAHRCELAGALVTACERARGQG